MISSQSVPLLAILASSLTLTCLNSDQIKSVSKSCHFHIRDIRRIRHLLPLSAATALARVHLSPANLTTVIHYTLASHKSISTNFNAFKTHWHASSQTPQNTNTSHQYSKNYTGFQSNKELITNSVFSHTKHLQINNQHIFTIVFHFLHILFLQCIFWFTRSFHSICSIITWQKGFLCHRSTSLEFTPSWYPKLVFFTNIPFPAQNTPLQNCFPSLGSFPSPWTVYPDFDSCYSHFMPYRMTPSVRHRAIEVYYYYYYYNILPSGGGNNL